MTTINLNKYYLTFGQNSPMKNGFIIVFGLFEKRGG